MAERPLTTLFDLALEAAGTGAFEWDIAADEVRWSANLSELRGEERGWHPTTFETWVQSVHPDDRDRMRDTALEASRTGEGFASDFRTLRPDGEVRWAETRTHVVCDDDGRPHALVGIVNDVTDRHRRSRGTAFLAQAGLELVRSLQAEAPLRRIAELAVPELADRCAIVLDDDDGARTPIGDAELAGEAAIGEVLESGRSRISSRAMVVPILARGRTLGAMTFVLEGTAREYGPFEVELAEELGRRAGLAVDNARLHEQVRSAAELLQRSLLPERLGAPGLECAAAYRPGEDGTQVGGDWYDVFELPGGRCAIVVGDVVGRGLEAAATMGQLRSWLRTHAIRRDDPAEVLADLDTDVELLGGVSFATCAVAFLDPATGRVQLASAGHLPGLIVEGHEAHFCEGATGPPLGVERATRATGELVLPSGATLVLYTDGLVERRDASLDARLEALRSAAAASGAAHPGTLVDALLDAMLERAAHPDDAVALAVTRR
jgi:hypothetical protein